MNLSDERLRFPIGPWLPADVDDVAASVARIQQLPDEYAVATAMLSDDALAQTYRPGSWTVRQLVHHVADTHLMHLFRLKNALLDPGSVGLMADVNGWAALAEARTAPVAASLAMLAGTHARIAWLAETLSPKQLTVTYYHPGRQRHLTLAQALDVVRWHGEHHLAHIELALRP